MLRFSTPLCVHSKRPPCVLAKRPHMFNVMAFCRYIRRRFECTHGGVLNLSTGGVPACQAAPHTEKHALHTRATPAQDTTRQDKTRQDKTRHDTTRHKRHTHNATQQHPHHHLTQHTHTHHTPHTHECLDMCLSGNFFDLESVSAMKKTRMLG